MNNNWYLDISLFHDGCFKLLQRIGRHMENKIITILFVVLIIIGLSGCGVKTINTTQDNKPTLIDSVGKMESIGIVLGCMFAPHTCSEVKENKGD